MSAGPSAPGAGGREIAQTLTGLVGGPGPGSALEAVHRIRAWHDAMRALSTVAEAQVMESCWRIRRDHQDRDGFDAFLRGHRIDRLIPVDRAWLMAQTWEVARAQRSLREIASDRPSEAIDFVREFVDAGRAEDLRELGPNDRRVAEILSAPPRRRTAEIRALIESHQERLALAPTDPPPAPPPAPDTSGDVEKLIRELRDLVSRLDGVAHALPDLLAGDPANRARRERIFSLTDMGTGALDAIASAATEAHAHHVFGQDP